MNITPTMEDTRIFTNIYKKLDSLHSRLDKTEEKKTPFKTG